MVDKRGCNRPKGSRENQSEALRKFNEQSEIAREGITLNLRWLFRVGKQFIDFLVEAKRKRRERNNDRRISTTEDK